VVSISTWSARLKRSKAALGVDEIDAFSINGNRLVCSPPTSSLVASGTVELFEHPETLSS